VAGGEFVAVRGASGSGKSTLLLACGGLQRGDTGRVVVDRHDVYAMSANDRAAFRAERIGFVFQRFHLVPYLSVRDNVLVASLPLGGAGCRSQAEWLLERLGMTERAGHFPSQLSTGERQRVALARAMLNAPKLLLADEPTGNLDPGNGNIVLQCLAEFARNGGAVLLVTHDPAAAELANRTILLEKGLARPEAAIVGR
jgi:putative ABC transport system ATP-binding protein